MVVLRFRGVVFSVSLCCLASLGSFFAGRGCRFLEVPVEPPIVEPSPAPKPAPSRVDAWQAIGRIQFGSAGCTATVIGPRRADGRWWVLTASHCVPGVGAHGTMRFKDGRTTGLVVASLDRRSDCAWCYTESNWEDLHYALLADSVSVGAKIWHGGYGVDRPGNREEGEVLAVENGDGQIAMRLSVSSGDSGGGICLDGSGAVVSCVCCTSARGRVATVWGAGPSAIRSARPKDPAVDEWVPLEIPLRHSEP